jgi:fatty-acyl-CoA synthase
VNGVIISGGENISSIEVEGALLRHPAIQEVAVVGVPHERWGEVPEAFVVSRSETSVSESELRDFAREALAHFKVPHRFTFIDELPKTATGKIHKYLLRRGRPALSAV